MLKPVTTEEELRILLDWRNRPEVRSRLFTSHVIAWEEHWAWWQQVRNSDRQRVLWYCDASGQPAGVANFYNIDPVARQCYWGFYLAPMVNASQRLRDWLELEREALAYAFSTLHCEQVKDETFAFNREVLDIHRRFGFQQTGTWQRDKDGQLQTVIEMTVTRAAFLARTGAQLSSMPCAEVPDGPCFALLGSANWDLAARLLVDMAGQRLGGILNNRTPPFGQYRQQLLDPAPSWHQRLDYAVFCERFEDLAGLPKNRNDADVLEVFQAQFQDYLELIRQLRTKLKAVFVLVELQPVQWQWRERLRDSALDAVVMAANASLRELASQLDDCLILALGRLLDEAGLEQADPGKYWHLGRLPYARDFTRRWVQELCGLMLNQRGLTARALVLDLDNTLWGGVLGDIGLAGLQLGPEYPGALFLDLQHWLRQLQARGMLLCACSKNDPDLALEAIDRHPWMQLRAADFTAMRVGWRDKPGYLIEIANELGLGLGSLCFIDDHPAERAEMRALLPEVWVPELPADPGQWPAFLTSYPALRTSALTEADRQRVQSYRQRAVAQCEAARYGSREDFLRSLAMRLGIEPYGPGNQERVTQLIAKTNQFNLSGRRYLAGALRELIRLGGRVLALRLADRLGLDDIIGVLVLAPPQDGAETWIIDNLVISCRVLGRGVEQAAAAWVMTPVRAWGGQRLLGRFRLSPRNGMAADFYARLGFQALADGELWSFSLQNAWPQPPDWIDINADGLGLPAVSSHSLLV